MAVEFKGGMTLSVKIHKDVDIAPGDVLVYDDTNKDYKANTAAIANIATAAISVDYDESGVGYIAVLPLYANFRMYNIPADRLANGIGLGVELAINSSNAFVAASASDLVVGHKIADGAISTESGGYIKA